MKRYFWCVAGVLMVVMLGCGAPRTPGVQPGETPTAQPTKTPLITVPQEAVELARMAREALAARLNQVDEAVDLIDVEPAEWPSAALGCPQPDRVYAQVITPGYIVRLKTGDRVYEVHVSKSGQVVFCDLEEESMDKAVPEAAQPAVMAVRRDLASRMNVELEAVQVVGFEAVEWSDSSLGCPEPGKMYLQVITPGYRVVLGMGDQKYEYHTNRGDRAVLCGEGAARPAASGLRLQEIRGVVERARTDLAQRLGTDPAAISVVMAAPVSQVDQPAACPEANQLTGSGVEYQLVLEAGRNTYTYRARGETLVLCSQ